MYYGFFEAHITSTLQKQEENKIAHFKQVCEDLGIKPIYIELERGDTPTQIMTSSLHEGDFETIFAQVKNIFLHLQNQGFQTNRMKIEAHPNNSGVPNTTEDILSQQQENYFECHFRLLLDKSSKIWGNDGISKNNIEYETFFFNLKNICTLHHAHLSKNAFNKQENKPEIHQEQRFVTQRVHNMGKKEAYQCFNQLENALLDNGFQIDKKIVEYCIFDDNQNVDKNWLTQETLPCENCENHCKMQEKQLFLG